MTIVEVYKALADENRLRILHALSEGPFNVQELTSILDASQSNVSHHLKTLQAAGLINGHKEGTWNYYRLARNGGSSPLEKVIESFLALEAGADSLYPKSFTEDEKRIRTALDRRRDDSHAYFESVAEEWSAIRHETVDTSTYADIIRKIIPDDATLLEPGCGSGAFLREFLPRSGSTIGVDYSPAMLDESKKNLEEFDVDLRLGYLEHLPIRDSSVDIAMIHMVLHHVAKPLEALKDAYRVIRPGGELIVVDLVTHTDEKMRERYADLWLGFDTKEFEGWASESGFANPRVTLLGDNSEVFLLIAKKQ